MNNNFFIFTAVDCGKFHWIDEKEYILPEDDCGFFILQTLATNDITLAFRRKDGYEDSVTEDIMMTEEGRQMSELYTVVIGGWLNTKTAIRKGGVEQVFVSKSDDIRTVIQDSNIFETRWVSINDGVISVGMGEIPGENEFISFLDSSPIKGIRCIGLGCWDSPVHYRISPVKRASNINRYSLLQHFSNFQNVWNSMLFSDVSFIDNANSNVLTHANLAILSSWATDLHSVIDKVLHPIIIDDDTNISSNNNNNSDDVNRITNTGIITSQKRVVIPLSENLSNNYASMLPDIIQLIYAGTSSQYLTDVFLPKILHPNNCASKEALASKIAALSEYAKLFMDTLSLNILSELLHNISGFLTLLLSNDGSFSEYLAAYQTDSNIISSIRCSLASSSTSNNKISKYYNNWNHIVDDDADDDIDKHYAVINTNNCNNNKRNNHPHYYHHSQISISKSSSFSFSSSSSSSESPESTLISQYPMFLDFIGSWVINNLHLQTCRHLFANTFLSDINFNIIGNGERKPLLFPAHRCILSAWPGPFSTMFSSSNYIESQANILTVEDISPLAMLTLLYFLYTGEFTTRCIVNEDNQVVVLNDQDDDDDDNDDDEDDDDDDDDNDVNDNHSQFDANTAVEVFILADRYCIDGLKYSMISYFEEHLLNRDNCIALLMLGDRHSCNSLVSKSVQTVASHFDWLYQQSLLKNNSIDNSSSNNNSNNNNSNSNSENGCNFSILDVDIEIFELVLKQEKLNVSLEVTALQAAITWCTHISNNSIIANRREFFLRLLKCIKFNQLTSSEFSMLYALIVSLGNNGEDYLSSTLQEFVQPFLQHYQTLPFPLSDSNSPIVNAVADYHDNQQQHQHQQQCQQSKRQYINNFIRGKVACRVFYQPNCNNKGLLYALGTAFGRQQWQNPATIPGLLKITSFSSLSRYTSAIQLSSRSHKSINFTSKFFTFQFVSHDIYIQSYQLQHDGTDENFLRTWVLQGSNDDTLEVWNDIHVVRDNSSLTGPNQIAIFHVNNNGNDDDSILHDGYKYIRLRTNDSYPLTLQQIEFYGTLTIRG